MSALGEERREAYPTRYLQALRDHWLVVVVMVAVSVGSAAAYSELAPKRYQASTDILVTPISVNDDSLLGFNLLRDSADPSRGVLTAARLVKTPQLADAVRARLGLAMTRRALLDAVAVNPIGQANILSIGAKASTASQAARIANGFADEVIRERTDQFQAQLVQRLDQLKSRLHTIAGKPAEAAIQGELGSLSPLLGAPDPTLHIESRAVPPEMPTSTHPVLSIIIALFASLLLGLGAALGLELINRRVNREEELLFVHRLPILARVPRMPRKQVHSYLAGRSQLPPEAWEAYRMLRANLATAGPAGKFPRTILMASAIRGEGKTMSALSLAITLANAGASVIVVDGDLRRPMVATVFGVASRGNGFADVFVNDARLELALVAAPSHGNLIRLVLASPEDTHLVDLLEPRRIQRGLERLQQEADVIIIDSPALTDVADALTLAAAVEAVLIVTRLGHTRADELFELRRMLAHRNVVPKGFIVTTRRSRRPGYDYATGSGRGKPILEPVSEPAEVSTLRIGTE